MDISPQVGAASDRWEFIHWSALLRTAGPEEVLVTHDARGRGAPPSGSSAPDRPSDLDRSAATNPPSAQDARQGLADVLGARSDDVWIRACTRAGIDPDTATLDDVTFGQLLDQIAWESPLCRVLALSWRIRRTAARRLADMNRGPA